MQSWFSAIPEDFFEFPGEQPFTQCTFCERGLLTGDVNYFIEKCVKGTETILEYAMCDDCRRRMGEGFSEESTANVLRYHSERAGILGERRERLVPYSADWSRWIGHCAYTQQPRESCQSYHLYAHCVGDQVVMGDMPFLLSGTVLHQIDQLVSRKTRGEMDRMIDDYFGLPPHLKALFEDQPLLV